MERIVIFANPISGRGRGGRMASCLSERLAGEGFDVQLHLDPARPDTPESLKGVRAVVAIGGDGTIRDVGTWLLRSTASCQDSASADQPPEMPPLLLIPTGTSNLLGKHLGIRWNRERDLDRIVAALRNPRIRHLDAAQVNGEPFFLFAGIGFDGWIVHDLTRIRKGPISKLSYIVPILRSAFYYNFPALEVSVDGREIFPASPALVIIANIREYGTSFPIVPGARPDDGQLDIAVLPCASRLGLILLFLRAALGIHLKRKSSICVRGRSIRIDSPAAVPVQIDGDVGGFTPLKIEMLPGRMPFLVP